MANIKYYFQVDYNGNPIPGSNRSFSKPPKGLSTRRWKEFTTQALNCCDPDENPIEVSTGKRYKYYVRLTENLLPINGTLRKAKFQPMQYLTQEVVGIYCCE